MKIGLKKMIGQYANIATDLEKAEKLFNKKEYSKALEKYKKITNISSNHIAEIRLATCYKLIADTQEDSDGYYLQALHHYKIAFFICGDLYNDKEVLLLLADTYISMSQYDNALIYVKIALVYHPNLSRQHG